jgi:epoxyqueuosine reductase
MIESILKSHLIPVENYIYGFADLRGLLSPKFSGFNYGISIGRILNDEIVDQIIEGPTMEYYSHYRLINEDLARLSRNISADLNNKKIETWNIEPTVSTAELDTIYYKTLRTDLSHKMVATRAGLGWIGKTDLFVSKTFGPRLRLVSILIKTQLIPEGKPVNKSRCGSCTKCVEACPAKAANGKLWDIDVEREVFFDPRKCRTQCTAFAKEKLGLDARVCGICVAVCPIGRDNKLMRL